ncbi:hypothetical protein FB45DRAFT_524037 [Roridomyces roridus]|uniref:Polyketide synthase n=1 Tax=Roridomyces roridus TaxID=1738132 RepID=A0AAD7FN00_9AGAR|nr:hypothetical protein FB45DRAFT_524037 [Roridomyces roridus]
MPSRNAVSISCSLLGIAAVDVLLESPCDLWNRARRTARSLVSSPCVLDASVGHGGCAFVHASRAHIRSPSPPGFFPTIHWDRLDVRLADTPRPLASFAYDVFWFLSPMRAGSRPPTPSASDGASWVVSATWLLGIRMPWLVVRA